MDSTLKGQEKKFTSKIPKDKQTLSSIKVNIPQSVPSDHIRKGPSVLTRSVALTDDFTIARKFGEGSVPLFEREGVVANSIPYNESSVEDKSINERFERDRSFSQSSSHHNVKATDSSVATKSKRGEYIHRGCCGKLPIPKSGNKSVNENRTTLETRAKVPYYRNEVRECDRLRRLYGDARRRKSRSLSPPHSSKYRSRRRSRSTSGDRHRDYSPYKAARSDSNNDHRSRRSHSRTHSPNRERPRRKQSPRHSRDSRSPCYSHKRHLNDGRTISRTHSSSLSQHARSSTDRDSEFGTISYESRDPPPSTYIPVPVPIADYAFSFPHWTIPQPPWPQHIPHRAPSGPFAFPLVPVMPPIRPVHQIRYMVPTPPVSYIPMTSGTYRPRPAYRYPHSKQNVANGQNYHKHQDKHK